MSTPIRIGTRDSRLAIWQASEVQKLLATNGYASELIYIKSEGDLDLTTPLYEMGVQGIFTRSLDMALLNVTIDVAVHSMKDVPTKLPQGITQAAVLRRADARDLLVVNGNNNFIDDKDSFADIGSSSIRRRAQWLHRYPNHRMHNMRGNMQTRLNKLYSEKWDAAIFAQAGLQRIDLVPENSIVLDWMLPAPAQGAIVVAARENDKETLRACNLFNDKDTAICTRAEREFLRGLMGGCSTPVGALAVIRDNRLHFRGNWFTPDGKHKIEIEKETDIVNSEGIGLRCAQVVKQQIEQLNA